MKPIITTFTGIALALGVALAGSAASAGNSHPKGTGASSYSTSERLSVFGSRTRDRALGPRHQNHFGNPFHGTYGREGVYDKEVYDRVNANNRRVKRSGN